jgi:hypothetical protein
MGQSSWICLANSVSQKRKKLSHVVFSSGSTQV